MGEGTATGIQWAILIARQYVFPNGRRHCYWHTVGHSYCPVICLSKWEKALLLAYSGPFLLPGNMSFQMGEGTATGIQWAILIARQYVFPNGRRHCYWHTVGHSYCPAICLSKWEKALLLA